MLLQAQRGFKLLAKSMAGAVILTIVMGFIGCMFWPVNKKNVIGRYQSVLQDGTPSLPDGGFEILELKADGICKQEVALKDGMTFSAQGTWEWRPHGSYFSAVMLTGIYSVLDDEDKILPDFEKTKGIYQSLPAVRTLTGRVLLGSREGPHYEKTCGVVSNRQKNNLLPRSPDQ